jgi:hypothetical protein
MAPRLRKFALTVHLISSLGWIGAVVAYLALGIAAVTSPDAQTVRGAWTAMELTGWSVIVPLAVAALLTGLVMSLGTQWGLFRHYWVLISFALTLLSTVVLVLHMPSVSAMASLARHAEGADLRALGGDLFHPGVGLLVLLAVAVLNVYKPGGVTPYGWRKQREMRHELHRASPTMSPASLTRISARQPRKLKARTAAVGYFLFHLAEMWLAMMLGMMLFVIARLGLTAQGLAVPVDASGIDFQAWMAVSMVAPMLAWMRFRGCGWRQAGEMGIGMVVPVVALLVLRGVGVADAFLRFLNSEHAAMLLGMLAIMLYRREHYSAGYTLTNWPVVASSRSIGMRTRQVER